MTLAGDGAPEALFCDNETNTQRLWGQPAPPYPKDGINDHVVSGAPTVEPRPHRDQGGPVVPAARWTPGATAEVRLRLGARARGVGKALGRRRCATGAAEADAFYAELAPGRDARRGAT